MNANDIRIALEEISGGAACREFELSNLVQLGGSYRQSRWRAQANPVDLFIKIMPLRDYLQLEASYLDLELLHGALENCATAHVPEPWFVARSGGLALFGSEYVELETLDSDKLDALAETLKHLHQSTEEPFGLSRDNFIGDTPQLNTPADDWISFWKHARLEPQIALATKNGLAAPTLDACREVQTQAERWLSPVDPALVHGDLWSGNFAQTPDGKVALYDPACYYGDPDVDIAMTRLFGRLDERFYSRYYELRGIQQPQPKLYDFYNLYHLLNHFNLFGGSYAGAVAHTAESLLKS